MTLPFDLPVVKSNVEPEQDDSEQSSTIDAPMVQIAPLAQIVCSDATFAVLHSRT
jgi:hypothetical protein